MPTNPSEASWIDALRDGDEAAAQRLWEEYFLRLVGLARMKSLPRRLADPSGVVQSALNSFFQAAKRNAFPQLANRDDLWRVLVVITARKAAHAVRDELRQKRGGGRVTGQSAMGRRYGEDFDDLRDAIDPDPTPEMAAILNEEIKRRLDLLNDERLQEVAVMKLHGYSNAEIAEHLECVERTVERKLAAIRIIWENEE